MIYWVDARAERRNDVLNAPSTKWFAEVFRTLHHKVAMYESGRNAVIDSISVSICMRSVGWEVGNFLGCVLVVFAVIVRILTHRAIRS